MKRFAVLRYVALVSLLAAITCANAQIVEELMDNSIFWLEADEIDASIGENISQWNSLGNDVIFSQTIEARFPKLVQGSLNGKAVLEFNNPQSFQHLVNNQNLDIISGSRTFVFIYRPFAENHGLMTRGTSFAGNPPEGSFGVFPFQENYRVGWTESGNFRFLNSPPNAEINQFNYVKIELDRQEEIARLFLNSEVIASVEISGEYFASNLNSILLGVYSQAFQFSGEIQFAACLNRVLNDEEERALDIYLGEKYGNYSINLGDDIIITPASSCEYSFQLEETYSQIEWSDGGNGLSAYLNGPGSISVLARDSLGFLYADTVNATFSFSTIEDSLIICSYDSVLWDLNISTEFDVDWSDGTNGFQNYLEPGTITFATIIHPEGCTDTTEAIVTLNDDFFEIVELILNNTFCLGNDLFLASGFEEAEAYAWSTGEDTPFIQPQESGEYWVEATNANGCVGQDTVMVDIVGVAPEVDFGFSPPCENNPVDFDDETIPEGGTITQWNWTFENTAAGTSDLENPAIFYETTGAYPVELTVTLDNGCTGTGRDTIFVNPLPLVNFSAPIVCAGNEVFFESLSGVPGGGAIASRAWSFGNGTTDTGTIGSTTFEELGFNTVTHIVTTEAQCTDSLTRNVEVLGSPIADFTAEDACLGSPITFTENVDISQSGPVFYNWQFGDGFFSNFPNTSHEYANPGVYEVTLTATGNNLGVNGCTDQITKSVRVYEPPVASLSTSDACIGAFTELVDLTVPQVLEGTADPIAERLWTITDGPTGSQQGPLGTDSLQLFLPLAPGTFSVQLDLTTLSGCEASAEGSLLAQSIPQANFNLELPIAAPPFAAIPENLSLDGEGFEWLINGEVVSTEFEPKLNFDAPGDYAVWLVATNTLECNDTAKVNYTVLIPEYDLEMISLRYETRPTGIVLIAIISNNSNVPVNTFDTRVEVGRDINLEFESEFAIPAGQLREYTLGTEIGYLPGRDLPYTCMRVSNPNGQAETDTANNYLCIELDEQKATFAAPFPNPANDEVNLAFILPEAGPVRVEIVGPDGRMVEDFVLELEEGLNELVYPLIGWSQGLYFVKFSYRTQEEVHRLVIAR